VYVNAMVLTHVCGTWCYMHYAHLLVPAKLACSGLVWSKCGCMCGVLPCMACSHALCAWCSFRLIALAYVYLFGIPLIVPLQYFQAVFLHGADGTGVWQSRIHSCGSTAADIVPTLLTNVDVPP